MKKDVLCRLCAKYQLGLPGPHSTILKAWILKHLGVDLDKAQLPTSICVVCVKSIDAWIRFHKIVQKTKRCVFESEGTTSTSCDVERSTPDSSLFFEQLGLNHTYASVETQTDESDLAAHDAKPDDTESQLCVQRRKRRRIICSYSSDESEDEDSEISFNNSSVPEKSELRENSASKDSMVDAERQGERSDGEKMDTVAPEEVTSRLNSTSKDVDQVKCKLKLSIKNGLPVIESDLSDNSDTDVAHDLENRQTPAICDQPEASSTVSLPLNEPSTSTQNMDSEDVTPCVEPEFISIDKLAANVPSLPDFESEDMIIDVEELSNDSAQGAVEETPAQESLPSNNTPLGSSKPNPSQKTPWPRLVQIEKLLSPLALKELEKEKDLNKVPNTPTANKSAQQKSPRLCLTIDGTLVPRQSQPDATPETSGRAATTDNTSEPEDTAPPELEETLRKRFEFVQVVIRQNQLKILSIKDIQDIQVTFHKHLPKDAMDKIDEHLKLRHREQQIRQQKKLQAQARSKTPTAKPTDSQAAQIDASTNLSTGESSEQDTRTTETLPNTSGVNRGKQQLLLRMTNTTDLCKLSREALARLGLTIEDGRSSSASELEASCNVPSTSGNNQANSGIVAYNSFSLSTSSELHFRTSLPDILPSPQVGGKVDYCSSSDISKSTALNCPPLPPCEVALDHTVVPEATEQLCAVAVSGNAHATTVSTTLPQCELSGSRLAQEKNDVQVLVQLSGVGNSANPSKEKPISCEEGTVVNCREVNIDPQQLTSGVQPGTSDQQGGRLPSSAKVHQHSLGIQQSSLGMPQYSLPGVQQRPAGSLQYSPPVLQCPSGVQNRSSDMQKQPSPGVQQHTAGVQHHHSRMQKQPSPEMQKQPSSEVQQCTSGMQKQPSPRIQQHTSGVQQQASPGIQQHASGVQQQPSAGLQQHTSGVQQQPSAGLQQHPLGVQQYPTGVQQNSTVAQQYSTGMKQYSTEVEQNTGVQQYSTGVLQNSSSGIEGLPLRTQKQPLSALQQHSTSMQQYPLSGIQKHSPGVQQHSTGLQQHSPSRMQQYSTGALPYSSPGTQQHSTGALPCSSSGTQQHSTGVLQYSSLGGQQYSSSAMQQHSPGVLQYSTPGVQQYSSSAMQRNSSGLQQYSTGVSQYSSGMQQNPQETQHQHHLSRTQQHSLAMRHQYAIAQIHLSGMQKQYSAGIHGPSTGQQYPASGMQQQQSVGVQQYPLSGTQQHSSSSEMHHHPDSTPQYSSSSIQQSQQPLGLRQWLLQTQQPIMSASQAQPICQQSSPHDTQGNSLQATSNTPHASVASINQRVPIAGQPRALHMLQQMANAPQSCSVVSGTTMQQVANYGYQQISYNLPAQNQSLLPNSQQVPVSQQLFLYNNQPSNQNSLSPQSDSHGSLLQHQFTCNNRFSSPRPVMSTSNNCQASKSQPSPVSNVQQISNSEMLPPYNSQVASLQLQTSFNHQQVSTQPNNQQVSTPSNCQQVSIHQTPPLSNSQQSSKPLPPLYNSQHVTSVQLPLSSNSQRTLRPPPPYNIQQVTSTRLASSFSSQQGSNVQLQPQYNSQLVASAQLPHSFSSQNVASTFNNQQVSWSQKVLQRSTSGINIPPQENCIEQRLTVSLNSKQCLSDQLSPASSSQRTTVQAQAELPPAGQVSSGQGIQPKTRGNHESQQTAMLEPTHVAEDLYFEALTKKEKAAKIFAHIKKNSSNLPDTEKEQALHEKNQLREFNRSLHKTLKVFAKAESKDAESREQLIQAVILVKNTIKEVEVLRREAKSLITWTSEDLCKKTHSHQTTVDYVASKDLTPTPMISQVSGGQPSIVLSKNSGVVQNGQLTSSILNAVTYTTTAPVDYAVRKTSVVDASSTSHSSTSNIIIYSALSTGSNAQISLVTSLSEQKCQNIQSKQQQIIEKSIATTTPDSTDLPTSAEPTEDFVAIKPQIQCPKCEHSCNKYDEFVQHLKSHASNKQGEISAKPQTAKASVIHEGAVVRAGDGTKHNSSQLLVQIADGVCGNDRIQVQAGSTVMQGGNSWCTADSEKEKFEKRSVDVSEMTACCYCAVEFPDPVALVKHISEAHNRNADINDNSKGEYACFYCDNYFISQLALLIHLKRTHNLDMTDVNIYEEFFLPNEETIKANEPSVKVSQKDNLTTDLPTANVTSTGKSLEQTKGLNKIKHAAPVDEQPVTPVTVDNPGTVVNNTHHSAKHTTTPMLVGLITSNAINPPSNQDAADLVLHLLSSENPARTNVQVSATKQNASNKKQNSDDSDLEIVFVKQAEALKKAPVPQQEHTKELCSNVLIATGREVHDGKYQMQQTSDSHKSVDGNKQIPCSADNNGNSGQKEKHSLATESSSVASTMNKDQISAGSDLTSSKVEYAERRQCRGLGGEAEQSVSIHNDKKLHLPTQSKGSSQQPEGSVRKADSLANNICHSAVTLGYDRGKQSVSTSKDKKRHPPITSTSPSASCVKRETSAKSNSGTHATAVTSLHRDNAQQPVTISIEKRRSSTENKDSLLQSGSSAKKAEVNVSSTPSLCSDKVEQPLPTSSDKRYLSTDNETSSHQTGTYLKKAKPAISGNNTHTAVMKPAVSLQTSTSQLSGDKEKQPVIASSDKQQSSTGSESESLSQQLGSSLKKAGFGVSLVNLCGNKVQQSVSTSSDKKRHLSADNKTLPQQTGSSLKLAEPAISGSNTHSTAVKPAVQTSTSQSREDKEKQLVTTNSDKGRSSTESKSSSQQPRSSLKKSESAVLGSTTDSDAVKPPNCLETSTLQLQDEKEKQAVTSSDKQRLSTLSKRHLSTDSKDSTDGEGASQHSAKKTKFDTPAKQIPQLTLTTPTKSQLTIMPPQSHGEQIAQSVSNSANPTELKRTLSATDFNVPGTLIEKGKKVATENMVSEESVTPSPTDKQMGFKSSGDRTSGNDEEANKSKQTPSHRSSANKLLPLNLKDQRASSNRSFQTENIRHSCSAEKDPSGDTPLHKGEQTRPGSCQTSPSGYSEKKNKSLSLSRSRYNRPRETDDEKHTRKAEAAKRAFLRHRTQRKSGGIRFPCLYCDSNFYYNSDLDKHFRNVHAHEYQHACNACDMKFQSRRELKYHCFTHNTRSSYSPNACRRY